MLISAHHTSIFKGAAVAVPVEVLAPFSRAAKFLAVNCFCFSLLHYSAKRRSLSLCSPRGCLLDSRDIVLIRLLLPLTTVQRLKSPWARPSPEIRPPFALLRSQVGNESDKCLIRDLGLLVWALAAVGATLLRLTPRFSPRRLFTNFLPLDDGAAPCRNSWPASTGSFR